MDPRTAQAELSTDLVLEGGGVKGIALVGAVQPLLDAGYRFPRIAGTSAGAIVGALLAALQRREGGVDDLEAIARSLDYTKFRDRGIPARLLGPFGFLADPLSLLLEDGAYEGKYLRDWLDGVLRDLGVRTFGDLRTDDPGDDGSVRHRYGLVVLASDLSRHRLAQLPWDYGEYGLDPDEQPVADAVRASASIPYFFEPVELDGPRGTATLVDGGLLSNYPIDTFDRRDENPPRWPTIGVRLDALNLGEDHGPIHPVRGTVDLGVALVMTSIEASQAEHVLDPCNVARSVYVDTQGVGATDFDLSEEDQERLLDSGRTATRAFLDGWDWQAWRRECGKSSG
jgi:NTE family protein